MRMSRLFSQTLREAPADAEVASHQFLIRAGFIHQHQKGLFSYLPLARRTLTKIENLVRQEMESIGGQEISIPMTRPDENYRTTNHKRQIDTGAEISRDQTGRDRKWVIAPHEFIADLARKEIHSYRQLPQLIYFIQEECGDNPKPGLGLIQGRKYTMITSYSLDASWENLERQYHAHHQAYFNIFHRFALPVKAVTSNVNPVDGQSAHQFIYLTPIGEDIVITCQVCGYSANRRIASFKKDLSLEVDPLPLEKVATPGCKTIEGLARFLGISKSRTAKAVFLMASISEKNVTLERFIFAIVRGDMEVNENKLMNAIHAKSLRPATEDEILSVGAQPGYGSPVGLKKALVIVDDAIPASPNLVSGANEEGYHLLNVNYGRDYQANIVTDIAAAQEGDACPECGNPLQVERGVEVGNIQKLDNPCEGKMDCHYLDAEGQSQPLIVGRYEIDIHRLLACIAEDNHDELGLIWPISVAPFQVHLVSLTSKNIPETVDLAERLYRDLQDAGIETLYDDRLESPGVKFNDADLIGLPIRLTLSERSLKAGGLEFKRRDRDEKSIVSLEQTLSRIKEEINLQYAEIDGNHVEMVFKGRQ